MNKLKDLGDLGTCYHSFKATIDKEEFELRNIISKTKGIEDKVIISFVHIMTAYESEEGFNK